MRLLFTEGPSVCKARCALELDDAFKNFLIFSSGQIVKLNDLVDFLRNSETKYQTNSDE